ncbi:MAG: helix-turn-helix transcriptional regulator [Magnetovibrio sp.]|nr:helix-turn-helix transcriptional regulator [Magnetovibrio sp.]
MATTPDKHTEPSKIGNMPVAQSTHLHNNTFDSDELDNSMPQRIKALRHGLGMSAATLDRQAGFTLGTTGRLERGDQRIYSSHLFHISSVTGMTIGYFYMTDIDIQNSPAAHSEELEKQQFLQAYITIKDPRLKRDVFELIETLANSDGGVKL